MDWAKLALAFIGLTVFAWKFWTKVCAPIIAHFEPIVNEITGPGNQPGIRSMLNDQSTQLATVARGVERLSGQVVELGAESRAEGKAMRADLQMVQRDVVELKGSQKHQGERIGQVEDSVAELRGVVLTVKEIQDARGCSVAVHRAESEETTPDGGPGGSGAARPGESRPTPRGGR